MKIFLRQETSDERLEFGVFTTIASLNALITRINEKGINGFGAGNVQWNFISDLNAQQAGIEITYSVLES